MIKILRVKRLLSLQETKLLEGTFVSREHFPVLIEEDTDAYDEDTNELLLKFRKNRIPQTVCEEAYKSLIKACSHRSKTLRMATKPEVGDIQTSALAGYIDSMTPYTKKIFKEIGFPIPPARMSAFTAKDDNWPKLIPMIKEIDKMYKELCPIEYEKQYQLADKTNYRIEDTSFTTITANLNTRTRVHKDSNDFEEGFGNLTVVSQGEYEGNYTGFPAYGVCVDVKQGDFLAMNVHEYHCNTEMINKKNANRISIISYLRPSIIKKAPKPEEVIDDDYFQIAKQIWKDERKIKGH